MQVRDYIRKIRDQRSIPWDCIGDARGPRSILEDFVKLGNPTKDLQIGNTCQRYDYFILKINLFFIEDNASQCDMLGFREPMEFGVNEKIDNWVPTYGR